MTASLPRFGAIEAGGTKFVLAVGTSPRDIEARHTIPTGNPSDTLCEAAHWFAQMGPLSAIGIATFGPAVVDPENPEWGKIGNTPKLGWAGCDVAGFFAEKFAIPIAFDTDVNGAAIGEQQYGAGIDAGSLAYVTVGTGIGGGLVLNGEPVHGAAHPEMGHIFPRRPDAANDFAGICPAHGDGLEGLASGPAIAARWGVSLSDLPADHEAHAIIADYLAQLCHAIYAMVAAEVIVLGGGVLDTPGLLKRVCERFGELDDGYLPNASPDRIVAPALSPDSGISGAIMLAEEKLLS